MGTREERLLKHADRMSAAIVAMCAARRAGEVMELMSEAGRASEGYCAAMSDPSAESHDDALPKRTDDNWICTFTGRQVWPMNPRSCDFDIRDIAHALANICRFTGHTRHFYCVAPATRILTLDMRWVPACSVRAGDALLGFDENVPDKSSGGRASRRKLRQSLVEAVAVVKRQCYVLKLSDGTELMSSAEHPWLIAAKQSRNQRWETTERIASAVNGTHVARGRSRGGRRYMLRFLPTWNTYATFDAGDLSGLLDGEGHVCFSSGEHGSTRRGIVVGLAQNEGRVLDAMKSILAKYGFAFTCAKNPQSNTHNITVRGGWREQFRLLGSIRTRRLLAKLQDAISSMKCRYEFPSIEMLEVVSAEPIGEQDVSAIQTSTRTYFAEGFGSHNSVAQHSYLASQWCPPEHAKWCLMHDAAEAYLTDIAKPVKGYFPLLKRAEEQTLELIADWLDLPWPIPDEVHVVDVRMLATERRDEMLRSRALWMSIEGVKPFSETIDAVRPLTAESMFLTRFYELFGEIG